MYLLFFHKEFPAKGSDLKKLFKLCCIIEV